MDFNEPAYVNKTTKAQTVKWERRIAQTSNADEMRATVGEINNCDCWVSCWRSSVVKIVNSASLVLSESQAGDDLVIRRRGPEGFLPSRVWHFRTRTFHPVWYPLLRRKIAKAFSLKFQVCHNYRLGQVWGGGAVWVKENFENEKYK